MEANSGFRRRFGRWFALIAALTLTAAGRAQVPEVAWEERLEVASGAAQRGPWRMNESDFRFVDDATVALNQGGEVAVAWADQARQDIFFQLYGPDGQPSLPEPVNVSGSGEIFSWMPRTVISDADPAQIYILWQEIIFSGGSHGGEILFARSLDGGRSFSPPLNLSRSIAGDGKGRLSEDFWHNGSLDLAQGPTGDLYAAWTEYEGRLWFARSEDGGASFSEPTTVFDGDPLPAGGPALAVGEDGTVHLAWGVGADPAADIYYSRSLDGGRSFSTPRAVFESAGHAWAPDLAVGPEGTVHLVYADSPEGPLRQYRILYSRSENGARFSDPQELPAVPQEHYVSANFPHIGINGDGRTLVVWELFEDPRRRPRALGYAVSDGGGFGEARLVPGSGEPNQGVNGSTQGLLMDKLAVNRAGALALVNSRFRAGQDSHVWLYLGQL